MSTLQAESTWVDSAGTRQAGYREVGDRNGWPVFYCHGLPGSRREVDVLSEAATQQGLRVIGVERPGYGVTSPLAGRAIGDEAADVESIAERLALGCFDIVGFSGGGPTALACAAAMPERVRRVSLVGSWAPFGEVGLDGIHEDFRQLWELAGTDFTAFAQGLRDALEQAGGPYELLLGGASDQDQAILAQPKVAELYRRALEDALRQGETGMLEDAAAVVAPWRFACDAVTCPVRLFHGEQDWNAPIAMAWWLEKHLPNARLYVWYGAAHFEAMRRWDEVLAVHNRG